MRLDSLFSIRRAIVVAVAMMLAATSTMSGAQARERATDGWLHSSVADEAPLAESSEPTDGWLHSVTPATTSPSKDTITDGWLQYPTEQLAGKATYNDARVASAPVTDGWLHSEIAESARTATTGTPVATTSSGFPTEIAVGSSLLASMLLAAGIMVILKRRHTSSTA